MELTERVNLKRAKWLSTLTLKEMTPYLKRKDEQDLTIKEKFNKITNYLNNIIKTNGVAVKLYTYSCKSNNELGGRLFSPFSIQSIQKEIRGALMDFSTDIDMQNAHPVILKYICSLHSIPCPNLEFYIKNRDEILNNFANRDDAKTLFIASINDSRFARSETNKFYKEFDKEMKTIQVQLYQLPIYKNITDNIEDCPNKKGKLINKIMCIFENRILQQAISFLNLKNIKILVLMFDGLMVDGNYYEDQELLNELMICCNTKFENLNMIWTYKPHSTKIVIPDDLDTEYIVEKSPSSEELKKQELEDKVLKVMEKQQSRMLDFELNYCKIINKGQYIHEYTDADGVKVINFLTYSQLTECNRHLEVAWDKYYLKTGEFVPCTFIQCWTGANPDIRQYDDVGVYPKVDECPDNIYNLWTPFYGDLLLEDETIPFNQDHLDLFRKHVKILSGNNETSFVYFEKWIAHMFQFPEQKSTCPILVSNEGAGKGSLTSVLSILLGGNKYMECTHPSRDIYGSFNGLMANSFLVNINEISKKEFIDCMGFLKGLVTDNKLPINQKGVPQYYIHSYHRFIMSTNNKDPIKLEMDNRRFFMCRSSDELCSNKPYFKDFYEKIQDPSFLKSIFSYYKTLPNVSNFNDQLIPVSEYQLQIQLSNISDVEKWIRSFVLVHSNVKLVEMLIHELYRAFNQWGEIEGLEHKTSCKKFTLMINQFPVGVCKGQHTRNGDTKVFNVELLKKYFNIGCLVDFTTD